MSCRVILLITDSGLWKNKVDAERSKEKITFIGIKEYLLLSYEKRGMLQKWSKSG